MSPTRPTVLADQTIEEFVARRRLGVCWSHPSDRHWVREPGGVVEELSHSGCGVVVPNPRHVVGDGGVEVETAVVDKAKGRGGGNDLGQREPQVGRLWRRWRVGGEVAIAEACAEHGSFAVHDRDGESGDGMAFDELFQDAVSGL